MVGKNAASKCWGRKCGTENAENVWKVKHFEYGNSVSYFYLLCICTAVQPVCCYLTFGQHHGMSKHFGVYIYFLCVIYMFYFKLKHV